MTTAFHLITQMLFRLTRPGTFSFFVGISVLLHLILNDLTGSSSVAPLFANAVPMSSDNSTDTESNGMVHLLLSSNFEEEGEQFVHPWIKLQQHINRSKRRLAKFQGTSAPSDDELQASIERRKSSVNNEAQGSSHAMLEFRPPRIKSRPQSHTFEDSKPKRRHSRYGTTEKSVKPDLVPRDDDGYSSMEAKMQKSYSVTNAPGASARNSEGLAIEANDVGYFVEVQIGSSDTKFKMLVDSGSSDTWVTGTSCNECGSSDRQKLGKSVSQSLKTTNDKYKISYGTGSVSVALATDSFQIAGLSLDSYTFGIASSESDDFGADKIPFDGLLGLGGKSLSITGKPTIVDALAQGNKINKPIVGVRLGRAAEGSSGNKGQITFGGVDQSQIDGSLNQLDNQSKDGYWAVSLDSVSIDSDQVSGGSTAVLDTGTSLIVAPKSAADKIHDAIPGAKSDGQGGYTIPCTTSKTLSFTFSGNTYSMDARDLLFAPKDPNNLKGTCISAVSTGSTMDGADWLLGAAFLKNVYFATNSDANSIGLGKLKQ